MAIGELDIGRRVKVKSTGKAGRIVEKVFVGKGYLYTVRYDDGTGDYGHYRHELETA